MQKSSDSGFTLIELLVVIAIIAILIGLLFPAFTSVMESTRKTQAKNDEQQIVTAVNGYYTEYGKYPIVTADTTITNNADLFYSLRAIPLGANAPVNGVPAVNPRSIVFISPPDVKAPALPKLGIATQTVTVNGISIPAGSFVDPWGTPYRVAIDGNYDNQLTNPYTADTGAGPGTLYIGVIVWAFGKNGVLGGGPAATGFTREGGAANQYSGSGDVISWQ